MKVLTVLWLQICKLVQMFIRSYDTATRVSPYCDLVCAGYEVGYIPAETLGEISLVCDRVNAHDC